MKYLMVIFNFLFSFQICFSQEQKKIDSLQKTLLITKPDSNRALLLSELSRRYRGISIDSAIVFAQRAITESRKIKFPKGEIIGLRMMAFAYRTAGNTPKALEINFKALKLANATGIKREKADVMHQIGAIYTEEHEYPKALFFLRESYSLSKSNHFVGLMGVSQNIIGRTYCMMNQLDSALSYCLSAPKNLSRQFPGVFAVNARDIGLIYTKKGDTQQALYYFKKSIKWAEFAADYEAKSRANYQIASLYHQSKSIDSAIYYANNALIDAKKGNFYDRIIEAGRLLSDIYAPKDKEKALQFSNMVIAANDSLYVKGKRNAIQNLTDFDEKERQYEIETAETAYKNQIKQYTLLLGLSTFLLVAFILYRNNRQKQKANTVLEKTLSQLKSTQAQLIQSEKLASLGELTAGIAHEIQNPLNFVNNFSEMSVELAQDLEEEIKNSPLTPNGGIIIEDKTYFNELISDLAQNQAKINLHGKRASSIVSGMLEHSRNSTGQRVMTDLNKLADEYLRLSYNSMKAKNKDFHADYELIADENLPLINVVPQDIGRVLLNLINNAFWAVWGVEKPKVIISTLNDAIALSDGIVKNVVIIKVTDNGTGMNEEVKAKIFQPFFTTKPTGEGTGLGLSLAYDIVTKGHGGTLEVVSTEGVGATFVITLPF